MATLSEALAIALEHHRAGRLDLAEEICSRMLRGKPDHSEALNLAGVIACERGRHEEAIDHLRRAIGAAPHESRFYNNLGEVYRRSRRLAEAVACYRRAVELQHDYGHAHYNLGLVLHSQGKLDEAVSCYQTALRLEPLNVSAYNNLGNAWVDEGRPTEARACFEQALRLKPDFAGAHSSLLSLMQCQPDVTPADLAKAHAQFEAAHARSLRSFYHRHENLRDPERAIRLGFVSADLGRHPVGYFLIRPLEHLDRSRFEILCYSDRDSSDDMTARFRRVAARWHDTRGLDDERLAAQVRSDRVDILFDLAGHTGRNRLLVFARKPAPIQVTWIGYEGTTGLRAIDYLVADRHLVPPNAEAYYCEQVLRMPDSYVCYDPPREAPPVGPLPATAAGVVTFGSFNNPAKITPRVCAVWAAILRRLPRSRLVLKYRGFDSPTWQSRLRSFFQDQGIAADRVEGVAHCPYSQYLASYNAIDIALDPFPFNGGVTTCDALWMGVPVITCPGETFASRHGLSHLAPIGITETIASALDKYVDVAVRLAQDVPRLAETRAGLRQRMAHSPLCDGQRFAAQLARLLRDVWRDWCSQEI